ncbi:MAG: type I restriction enzyme HsdR N-terminal domain-containing protein [Deltaproteobacteria bacterium]|nr:type I restriction enzyme HsdR N-terminal domain-containing protein [Deltaproteobacteria bacterium]
MDDWLPLTRFIRAGREVVFDPCRKLLVPATPEELVRQCFVQYLQQALGYPIANLLTEEHLSRWGKARSRRRADIIAVLHEHTDEGHWMPTPLLVVECKAPKVSLLDDHLDQLLAYDDIVETETGLVVLTNGLVTHWYDRFTEELTILEQPVRFRDALDTAARTPIPPSPPQPRPPFGMPTDATRELFLTAGVVGRGSSPSRYEELFNLAGLFHLEPEPPPYEGAFRGHAFLECGDRVTGFGNAAGGRWDGFYRYFHIRSPDGESQVVSISVLGKMLTRDDPRFGNTSGHTMLVVAVDDFDRRHNSLQLDLDRFSLREGDRVRIWHDGRLTRGKRGAAKRADVVEFVAQHAPHLVSDGTVQLGSFPADRLATWADVQPLVENLIEYALVRDRFRNEPLGQHRQ